MVLSMSRDRIQIPAGSTVTLSDQTWADYEALLASRRDRAMGVEPEEMAE